MGVPAIGSAAVEKAYTWIRGRLPAVNNGLGLVAEGLRLVGEAPALVLLSPARGLGAPVLGLVSKAPGLGLGPVGVRRASPMNTSRKSVAF